MVFIVIVVNLFDRPAKGKQGDDIRDNHHGVKAVRHVPYKVNLCQRAEQYTCRNKHRVDLNCLRAEQVLHIRLAEEIPAKDRTESEEEHTDCDKDISSLAVQRGERILAQLRAGLSAGDGLGRNDNKSRQVQDNKCVDKYAACA